jgi:Uncharacterized protein conserved in bacteria
MWRLSVLLAVCLALAIYGSQQGHHTHSKDVPISDLSWTELNSSMEQMHKAMASIDSSGNVDADFVKLMLPHHQAAIEMAKTQLKYGSDPQMRSLAQQIITDQQLEIELMQLWLKQHADFAKTGATNEQFK